MLDGKNRLKQGQGWRLGWRKPGLEPVEHPTLRDIAWAAGIHEGEGTVSACQRTVYATVSQSDEWLPHRLKALFGGSVFRVNLRGKMKKPQWRWQLGGTRARGFAMTIYTFLSPRRQEQIRKALHAGH